MSFVWVTHHVSATRWLKAELAERAPHLRFAFSRPGLTTFKVEGPPATPSAAMPSSFARAWGLSVARGGVAESGAAIAAQPPGPLRLHVFERDVDVPVDEQPPAQRGARAAGVAAALRGAYPAAFLDEVRARVGDLVLDIIVPHGGQPDEPWLIGVHRHDSSHGPWPGGVDYLPAPARSPSRAWSKLEEALAWGDVEPRPGEIAVELGAAPGGASLVMLDRGLDVHGVDPGAIAPQVLAFAGPHGNRFVHHQLPAAEVDARDLPRRYQWLLMDVNLAPMVALRYAERFVALAHHGLRAAVLTLKLNDDAIVAALPRLLERIRKLGAAQLRVTQLPSHRSEVVAILTW
ncbi:MAG TPA: SAM-dependent methyltransferase [Kofleriaceae bacterium]|nr:SAM-dependent methyltransferase [Kofleriaceae bacterium]